MSQDFEKGVVVRLKSGSPKMTVTGKAAYGGDIICVWFDDTKRCEGTFPAEALEIYVKPAAPSVARARGNDWMAS